jgi:hypothetical protein
MKVIHVLRKPCSEANVAANVLRHGTGAINIDGCRVGVFVNTNQSGMDRHNARMAELGYRPKDYAKGEYKPPHSAAGRWPANLILQHLDGCVKGPPTRVRANPSSKTFHEGYEGVSTVKFLRGASHPGNQHGDEGGMETVDHWTCIEGCPIMALGIQSGERKSTGNHPSQAVGGPGNVSLPGPRRQGALYADIGDASRYFKQVKS